MAAQTFQMSEFRGSPLYHESTFAIGSLAVALGTVENGVDPVTAQPCKVLRPLRSTSLSASQRQRIEAAGALAAWNELTSTSNSVWLVDPLEFSEVRVFICA